MKKPTTHMAVLPSAGYGDGRATRHKFLRYEEVEAGDLLGTDEGTTCDSPGKALVYECEETGAERRWGIEE